MAITIELDKVSQSTIIETETQVTIVRRGTAFGLNTTGLLPREIIAAVAPVLTAAGHVYNSAYPVTAYSGCLLKGRTIEGITGNARKARIELIYRSPGGLAVPPVTFVLTRQTVTRRVRTELDPKTLKPIVTVWRDPANATRIVTRLAELEIDKTYQRLVADGYYIGQPPAAMMDAFNSVNDAPWRGLPKGYWHYSGQSDVTRDYGNSYNVTIELETKRDENWAYYATTRIPGIYIKVDQNVVDLLKTNPYTYGMGIFNGITRVCPYPEASFSTIFGFGAIGGP